MAPDQDLSGLISQTVMPNGSPTLTPEQRQWLLNGSDKAKRVRWTYLEATPVLIARFQQAQAAFQQAQADLRRPEITFRLRQSVRRLEAEVAEGLERDEAQTGRPDGCWCFGLGGRDQAGSPIQPDEPLWLTCCPYCAEGQEAQYRKDEMGDAFRNRRQVLSTGGWLNSGVPARFLDLRLETHPLWQTDLALMQRLSAFDGSCLLYGPNGVGKTGLAVGMAYEWRQRHRANVRFVTLPGLLAMLRNSYSRPGEQTEKEIIDDYAAAPLLVLDEVGAEQTANNPSWLEDRLYQIIGARYNELRPTIFTSNYDMRQTTARLGPRLAGRIVQMCGQDGIMLVQGPNLRK